MRQLDTRVRALEARQRPPVAPCGTCGGSGPMAYVGGDHLPSWAIAGRCCACGRAVRWYVGIDVNAV